MRNGISAQYRPFNAINGRMLEWFILKAMNTTYNIDVLVVRRHDNAVVTLAANFSSIECEEVV